MTKGPRWARVQRLDPYAAVDALHRHAGLRLEVEGLRGGGQVGAATVRWPDGRRSVLKVRRGISREQMLVGPVAVIDALRQRRYPAPAVEVVEQVDDLVITVWELLPGSKPERVHVALLAQLLDLNDRQAHALAGDEAVPSWPLYLTDDGPGFCLHEPLREHSARSARLLRWILAVGDHSPANLSGDDAVHGDFTPDNVLAGAGAVTGVVDWDGAARGDRRLDLITLRFGMHATWTDPAAIDALDALLDELPEEILRATWAHMSLRMVDWAIRHFRDQDVQHWLDLSEQRART